MTPELISVVCVSLVMIPMLLVLYFVVMGAIDMRRLNELERRLERLLKALEDKEPKS